MKILIDTHVFLWFVSDVSQLTLRARNIIEDADTTVYLSIASLWEISIKHGLKKLRINGGYSSVITDVYNNSIRLLPIEFLHTVEQNKLPFYHRDPFDRMIVSQAIVEDLNLVSRDPHFDPYLTDREIERIW